MTAESFRHCFNRLPEATLLVSLDGLILEANAAAKALLCVETALPGASLRDLVLDPPEKLARLLKLSGRSRELLPGSLAFRNGSPNGIPCRIESALFNPEEGGSLLLRLFLKDAATQRFRTLNERIDTLNAEVLERRRVQTQLHAQQELLRTTLLSIGDGVIATDASGKVTFLNPVAQSLTGWTREEAAGKPLEELFVLHNEYTGMAVENPAGTALREGRIVGLANHTTLTAKDGRLLSISDSAAPIRNADGEITGVVLVFRDVTERKRAEEERQRLVFVVENSPDFIGISDTHGVPVYVNRAGQSLVGAENLAECQRVAVANYFVPDEQEFVRNVVLPAVYEKGVWKGELHFRHFRTGEPIPVLYDVFRIDDPHTGRPINFATLTRDITERKRAEETLRRTVEFDEAVMTNMSEGIVTVDAQGLVTFLNPAAKKLFGWSLEELGGRKMHDMTHHHHRDGRPFPAEECAGLRVLQDGKSLIEHEDVFIRKDGTFFDVSYSSSALCSGSKILGLVMVFRDLSESKRNERKLRQANEALLRANEDLNQFAFAASHDLQEPLRMITSYSQLLIKGYRGHLDEEAALCVDFIDQGTQRMRELLADLLAYTQLSEGDDSRATSVTDLNLVFRKAIENCRAAIEDSGAVVTTDPLPTVSGHEPRFLQLFQNLIGNAIKYRGASAPRIHVSAKQIDGAWRLAVADNGMGIAPEYHERIFGVFKRLHGKKIPGTGIGLAICKRVVEGYGGKIWVESRLNEGATFYFTLPIVSGASG